MYFIEKVLYTTMLPRWFVWGADPTNINYGVKYKSKALNFLHQANDLFAKVP
jgi:hypothetical protein